MTPSISGLIVDMIVLMKLSILALGRSGGTFGGPPTPPRTVKSNPGVTSGDPRKPEMSSMRLGREADAQTQPEMPSGTSIGPQCRWDGRPKPKPESTSASGSLDPGQLVPTTVEALAPAHRLGARFPPRPGIFLGSLNPKSFRFGWLRVVGQALQPSVRKWSRAPI